MPISRLFENMVKRKVVKVRNHRALYSYNLGSIIIIFKSFPKYFAASFLREEMGVCLAA